MSAEPAIRLEFVAEPRLQSILDRIDGRQVKAVPSLTDRVQESLAIEARHHREEAAGDENPEVGPSTVD